MQKRMQELEKHHREVLKQQELTPGKSPEKLMASRRQLESLRQRLQLEASKFQVIIKSVFVNPTNKKTCSLL